MNEVVWASGRQQQHPHHLQVMLGHHQSDMGVVGVGGGVPTSGGIRHAGARSQDDAMVAYFFQRPQTDPDFQNYNKQSRWALGDDSVLEVRGSDTSELESGFQALALETGHQLEQISASTKKLWGVEEAKGEESAKGLFLADQWRDTPWTHNAHVPPASGNYAQHAVSQPIMVQRRSGSYPGSDAAAMLSPRSSETGGLGMKMAEYVLGTSPTSKDNLEPRISRLQIGMNPGDVNEKGKKGKNYMNDSKNKEGEVGMIQANGIIQNGLDDDKTYKLRSRGSNSRQASPSEEDVNKNVNDNGKMSVKQEGLVGGGGAGNQMSAHGPGAQMQQGGPQMHGMVETGYDPVGIDTLHFDYSSQLMPSMDSPSMLDYSSQIYQAHQQRNQQSAAQQQQHMTPMMAAAAAAAAQQQQQQQQQQYQQHMSQQSGGGNMNPMAPPGTPYQSSPYMMSQDPYAPMGTIMASQFGPAVMPQYYGMPPWGVFPTPNPGMMGGGQGGQQGPAAVQHGQLMRGGGARPMTPQGGPQDPGGPNQVQTMQQHGGGYQMIPPPYYDQNGSLMMSNARGMGTPMRLVPPVLMNGPQAGNNPNGMSNGGMRLMGTGAGQGGGQNGLGNNGSGQLYQNGNGMGPYNPAVGFSSNSSNHLGMGQSSMQPGSMGYGGSPLGPIGSSTLGSLSSGLNVGSPRRDSLDRRDSLGFSSSLESSGFSRGGMHGGGGGVVGGKGMGGGANSQQQQPYYGSLGTMSASPGPIGMMPPSQSLTPPPSLNGSTGNLSLGALGGRILSAAPGAEAKFMVRNGPLGGGGGIFGSSSSLFPSRSLQRNASFEKTTGRSRLLEDFRNNRYPNLQLRDLANHIVEFSQDQHGSRFIQQKLERATPAEKQMVFSEILGAAYSLMTDVFGNYVIQKFFEFGTPEQKQSLAQKVKGHVLPLALQMYGCRVIQKALESIPPEQQFILQKEVVKELDGHVLKCVKDQNGNHVVQKCIECVDPMALQFIINAFQGQVFALSTHPYGCRVIQRILEHCTPEQTLPILEELHQHTEQLVQDQYGNYVVQHVLEHGRSEDKSKIVAQVRGKVLVLSQHKFASNVVEKCVTHSSRAERTVLIEEVCTCHDGALYTMMKDQYANYVVQKMIEVAEPNQRKLLVHKIRPHIASLRKYTYGKHILAKLEKYLVKNNDLGPIGAPPPNGNI